ncbi:Hypothetical protein R9X50_00659300 [Acrodontium crateriforme]|uniref:Rhodopsin domain-containing protein n=1 Tax=Acrodontium crateriforme TaxID=150365 RepID=A0AAQ3M9Y6_9PEZI|nr:Hypothetical protein R9X50_00659300 [Acrodontium crateriforme]
MFRMDADDINHNLTATPAADSRTEDIGWQALGPTIACSILATSVVALRWYTRRHLFRRTGLDDHVILLSLILSWAMCSVTIAANGEGLGVYNGFIDATHLAKLLIANNTLWILTVNCTKTSILLQYLRVFSSRTLRTLCYILTGILISATCWAVFGGLFLCHPVAKLWNPSLLGTCLSSETYWTSAASLNIAIDVLILILPLPSIARLYLPRKEKICIILVFTLGFFVCVVSSLRLGLVVATANQGDYVLSGIWSIIWSAVEANVGIICASLPALKPLVYLVFPDLMRETGFPRRRMQLPVLSTDSKGSKSVASSTTMPESKISENLNRSSTLEEREETVVSHRAMPNTQDNVSDLEAGYLSVMDMLHTGPNDAIERDGETT